MPIRIMHVVDNLGNGGLENALANLIGRLDPACFEHVIYVLRHRGGSADRLAGGVRVISPRTEETGSRFHIPALVRAIRQIRPDIVHSRNWGAGEAVLAGRCRRRSCALVHSEHGIDSSAVAGESWRRTRFRRVIFELADRVVSVSCQLRDLHARRTGFPARKITVIHNGVDSERYFPNPAARARVRQELGLGDSEFCIGCVGNLFPVKDHMTLLKAVAEFAGACVNWRLLVIGDGSELPRLQAFVNAHEWSRRVFFSGSSNRVPDLLNGMDAYALPSISEGISNSLLEAMASGLPVVATAAGGNPEVIVDGQSGLLFPVADSLKLAELLLSLESRRDFGRQLAQQAIRRVREEFSMDAMVRKYQQLYQSLAPADAMAPVRAAAEV